MEPLVLLALGSGCFLLGFLLSALLRMGRE